MKEMTVYLMVVEMAVVKVVLTVEKTAVQLVV